MYNDVYSCFRHSIQKHIIMRTCRTALLDMSSQLPKYIVCHIPWQLSKRDSLESIPHAELLSRWQFWITQCINTSLLTNVAISGSADEIVCIQDSGTVCPT